MRNGDRESEGERDRESYTFSHSLTHSITHSYSHLLTHPFSHSHTHSLTHSLTHALIHSPILLLTHSHSICAVSGLTTLWASRACVQWPGCGSSQCMVLSLSLPHSLRTVPHIPLSCTLSSSLFIHPIFSQTYSLTLTLPLSLSLTVLIKRCGGSCRDHEINSNSHEWGNWQNRSEKCVKK